MAASNTPIPPGAWGVQLFDLKTGRERLSLPRAAAEYAIVRVAPDGDGRYRQAMLRALQFVMSTQLLDGADVNVRGGIKGSQPVWGRYACLSYPNWATKFFIDAMWLRKEIAG